MSDEISVMTYATESEDKVRDAIERKLDIEGTSMNFERQELRGHFGNEIVRFTIDLAEQEQRNLARRILQGLTVEDCRLVLRNLDLHTEGDVLYLRLDKQDLCLDRLSITEKDPVRLALKVGKDEAERLLQRRIAQIEREVAAQTKEK